MKAILVTGGAGFIGSNFIIYLLTKYKNYKVINVDKLTYAGHLENLREIEGNENYSFKKGDICDKNFIADIFKNEDIQYVVNFAAESHVDRSIRDPELFVKTNVLGTANLLDVSKRSWEKNGGFEPGKKFIQISTDEVYGSLGESGYFTEKSPLDPHSPYSASKASADLLVKAYYETYGMPVNITRSSNNYGARQYPEKLIPLTIDNCLKSLPLSIYGDGRNIRDWLFVEDHCKAVDMVLSSGKPGEIYNIGGNCEKQNIDVVEAIISIIKEEMPDGSDSNGHISEAFIKYIEDRKGHDRRYAIDAGKIKKELGWVAETSFEDGIRKTIRWYLENQDWLAAVSK